MKWLSFSKIWLYGENCWYFKCIIGVLKSVDQVYAIQYSIDSRLEYDTEDLTVD
jgi:hypothetical protein